MKLLAWLDRHMGVAILVTAMLVMTSIAYSSTIDLRADDQVDRIVRAESGKYAALAALASGMRKPAIVDAANDRLILDVSTADATIRVDGAPVALHRMPWDVAADGDLMHVAFSLPQGVLGARVQLREDGATIDWTWLRAHDDSGDALDLELSMFAPFMLHPSYADGTVTYRLPAQDVLRSVPPLPLPDARDYAVAARFEPAPDGLWFGETVRGVDAFHVRYVRNGFPIRETAPLFTQHVSYSRTSDPAPPATDLDVRGIPYESSAAVALRAGPHNLSVAQRTGAGKPFVWSPDGRVLLDYASWDATLSVNGTTLPLYRHAYDISAVGDAAHIRWTGAGYALDENITVTAEGVRIAWTWLREPSTPAHDVALHLVRFARHYENATWTDRGATFTATGERAELAWDRAPDRVWLGETPQGADAFHTVHSARFAEGAQHFLLETVRVGDAAGSEPDGAPVARVATLVRDDAANAYRLDAGAYRASIALGKGADKPLLRDAQGRSLVEVSAWGSELWLAGAREPVSLYEHEWRLNSTGDAPCLEWFGAGYALRQCIRVTSDGMQMHWAWRQETRGAVPHFTLEAAHFAAYMHDLDASAEGVAYTLHHADGATTRVRVAIDAAPVEVRPGETPHGIDAFRLKYVFGDLPPGEWVPLFATTTTAEDVSGR